MEDRLTKLAHFIPVKSSGITKYLAKLYTDNIVQYHGIPKEIVSNGDLLLTSHSWKAF